jgi:nickel transport protein
MVYLFSVALWLVFSNVPAWAHRVTIFAWVEGDTVYTQSKFSGGRKAKGATVVVYDKEGNQLLDGSTDEKGQFSFKVPQRTELKVALKASVGHLAEWAIPAEEIMGAAASLPDDNTTGELRGPIAVGLSHQQVQAIIDESLDRKLAPITNMLANSLDRGPRVSEVIGGIGYIFGLVGVALYFSTRHKGNR